MELIMNEDLPLDRHAVSICWLAFIIGTALLLIIPGIFQNYNLSQVSEEPVSVSPNVRFHAIIQEASDLYQVEPELIRAIIMAESSNNPRAVSKKGARGLMQLMPATAKALGVEDSFDPELNIHGGVRYFRQLLDRFDGDTSMALAAYNAGSKNVRQYQGIPPFKTTRYYIKKVISYYDRYKAETENV